MGSRLTGFGQTILRLYPTPPTSAGDDRVEKEEQKELSSVVGTVCCSLQGCAGIKAVNTLTNAAKLVL